jgi:hypothetical protein
MTAPGLTYATFYAVSRNTRRWWDLGGGHRLGFDPADDAEEHAGAVEALPPLATPGGPQSAEYTDPDYTLARQRQVPGPPRP